VVLFIDYILKQLNSKNYYYSKYVLFYLVSKSQLEKIGLGEITDGKYKNNIVKQILDDFFKNLNDPKNFFKSMSVEYIERLLQNEIFKEKFNEYFSLKKKNFFGNRNVQRKSKSN